MLDIWPDKSHSKIRAPRVDIFSDIFPTPSYSNQAVCFVSAYHDRMQLGYAIIVCDESYTWQKLIPLAYQPYPPLGGFLAEFMLL